MRRFFIKKIVSFCFSTALSGLSEMPVARGSAVVDFPDFTRGQWIHRKPKFAL
jgi:hypothetical protein